jgi:predicted Fe-S protein YdhL (DUF1289 family)
VQQVHAKSNSPCINVCTIIDGYCKGCRRTAYEITSWAKYTDNERMNVLIELDKRDDRNMGKT